MRKPVVRISDQVYETNRVVPPQEIAKGSNFGFTNKKVEGLYYPCSKNKAVVLAESPSFVFVFTLKNGVS